jgi:hypothetical protein
MSVGTVVRYVSRYGSALSVGTVVRYVSRYGGALCQLVR